MLGQFELSDKMFNDFLMEESERIRGLFTKLASKDPRVATIPPMLVLILPNGEGGITAAPLILTGDHDAASTEDIMFQIGVQAFKNKMSPMAIFLSTEAWARSTEDPDDTPPSEDDDEVIFTAGLTFDDRSNFVSSSIRRTEDGPVLEEPEVYPYDRDNPTPPDGDLQQFFVGYLSEVVGGSA